MVYFDNAATTYPKPYPVVKAVVRAFEEYGANPGRSGHQLSQDTAGAVFDSRQKCADFFGADVENVSFVLNCTAALNFAIKGIMADKAHIITTDLEHNSVIRPIHAAARNGCSYSVAKVSDNDFDTLSNIEELITPKTKAIICTIASNVTGQIVPYRLIGELCRRKNICFIVDAAQGAGILPISLDDGINIICCAGHKGLYGPMGTGLLITDGKYLLKTIIEGGTGSSSNSIEQPLYTPDRFESGTINTSGVIGLGAGVDFIVKKGIDSIYKHEMKLCNIFVDELWDVDGVQFYHKRNNLKRVPVISFNIKGTPSDEMAAYLSDKGYCLRAGLHCSFLAHTKIGTAETGTVRFAPSFYNKAAEAYDLAEVIKQYLKK